MLRVLALLERISKNPQVLRIGVVRYLAAIDTGWPSFELATAQIPHEAQLVFLHERSNLIFEELRQVVPE